MPKVPSNAELKMNAEDKKEATRFADSFSKIFSNYAKSTPFTVSSILNESAELGASA
jgi:hypothetical protein